MLRASETKPRSPTPSWGDLIFLIGDRATAGDGILINPKGEPTSVMMPFFQRNQPLITNVGRCPSTDFSFHGRRLLASPDAADSATSQQLLLTHVATSPSTQGEILP